MAVYEVSGNSEGMCVRFLTFDHRHIAVWCAGQQRPIRGVFRKQRFDIASRAPTRNYLVVIKWSPLVTQDHPELIIQGLASHSRESLQQGFLRKFHFRHGYVWIEPTRPRGFTKLKVAKLQLSRRRPKRSFLSCPATRSGLAQVSPVFMIFLCESTAYVNFDGVEKPPRGHLAHCEPSSGIREQNHAPKNSS
jgi:hypothetical protein